MVSIWRAVEKICALPYAKAMMSRAPFFSKLLLLSLLVLGLGVLPLAHGALRAPGPDFSAFAMPDGTVPQICGQGSTGESDSHCPDCCAGPLAVLPVLAVVQTGRITAYKVVLPAALPATFARSHLRPAQPRAPPLHV